MSADNLLIRQLSAIAPDDGASPNALLSEFFQGRPLMELQEALHHEDDSVVDHAVWIASELGSKAAILMDDIYPLLHHVSPKVRYTALDVVLLCANSSHGKHLRSAISLLQDDDIVVRVSAMFFCIKASQEQISAAINDNNGEEQWLNSDMIEALRWLASTESCSVVNVRSELSRQRNSQLGLISVIAAARLGDEGKTLLADLGPVSDETVSRFLEVWLED